jgi:hypothetical protein
MRRAITPATNPMMMIQTICTAAFRGDVSPDNRDRYARFPTGHEEARSGTDVAIVIV